ncbi:MAG: DMT family transporter [Anaerolineales bacterium]|nr:DMT family transporter [Anaerolineales bacterium]
MSLLTIRKSNQAWLAIGLLIFAAATTPIFIRFAQHEGVPSLAIIVMRLILATLLLTPFAWQQHHAELTHMSRHDWGWAMSAGAFHAFGLFCLFFALENTSVLVNSVLRRTSPLWTIILEILVLHAIFSRQVWLGIVLTLLGSGLVAFGGVAGLDVGTRPLLGAGLSMINAITLSIYLIIGRKLRDKLSFLAYTWTLFMAASLVALFFAAATRTPLLGYSLAGYGWVLVITVVAQLAGHLPVNFAVRYVQATHLSVLLQISVVASAFMAFLYFGEIPSWLQVSGSLVIIAGVSLVTFVKRR